MANAVPLVNDYLTAFWSGDFATAQRLVAAQLVFDTAALRALLPASV